MKILRKEQATRLMYSTYALRERISILFNEYKRIKGINENDELNYFDDEIYNGLNSCIAGAEQAFENLCEYIKAIDKHTTMLIQ